MKATGSAKFPIKTLSKLRKVFKFSGFRYVQGINNESLSILRRCSPYPPHPQKILFTKMRGQGVLSATQAKNYGNGKNLEEYTKGKYTRGKKTEATISQKIQQKKANAIPNRSNLPRQTTGTSKKSATEIEKDKTYPKLRGTEENNRTAGRKMLKPGMWNIGLASITGTSLGQNERRGAKI